MCIDLQRDKSFCPFPCISLSHFCCCFGGMRFVDISVAKWRVCKWDKSLILSAVNIYSNFVNVFFCVFHLDSPFLYFCYVKLRPFVRQCSIIQNSRVEQSLMFSVTNDHKKSPWWSNHFNCGINCLNITMIIRSHCLRRRGFMRPIKRPTIQSRFEIIDGAERRRRPGRWSGEAAGGTRPSPTYRVGFGFVHLSRSFVPARII